MALLGSASSFVGGFGAQRALRGGPAAPLRANALEAVFDDYEEDGLSEVANSAVGVGGCTELMMAAQRNSADAIADLAKGGADVDEQDSYGWTAMRYAVRANNKEAATALIKLGAKVDKPSESGRTPLMSAAANGISDMVKLLLANGADVSLKSMEGTTALDLAKAGGSDGCQIASTI